MYENQKKITKKETDIVFVNPPLSNEERYGVKFKAGGQTPPTGLCYLASVCRERKYQVRLIDAPALNLDFSETIEKILELKPKYVGVTAVTISINNASKLIKELKQKDPKLVIILGGAHITSAPNETVRRLGNFFDIAVMGEGEITILELLEVLEKKEKLSKVNGIAYFKNKKLVLTKPREFIKDLDSLPFPAWDLLPDLGKNYTPPAHTIKRFPAALLVTSRGCPGMCTFCDNKVFGRKIRCHSAGYVIRMIKHLQKNYGIKEVQFRDDNFLVFRERTVELCKQIIEQKINLVWSCAGRVDMINPETLKLMKSAGCWQIWYGIESGSDSVLKAIKKNTDQKKITEAIINTKRYGISPCGFFMIGLPTEKEEDVQKTIRILLTLPIDEFHMTHMTPFPGSEIYSTASQYGSLNDEWSKMSCWKTVFIPSDLSEDKLVYYSNLAFKKFYFRPRIIISYIKKVQSLSHLIVYATAFFSFLVYVTMKQRR